MVVTTSRTPSRRGLIVDVVPTLTLTTAAHVKTAAADLERRAVMLRTVPHVGPDDVPGPTIARLVNRELFALTLGDGVLVLPRYQFAKDGEPLPVMEAVIAVLDRALGKPRVTPDGRLADDWDLALWMFTPNPLLVDRPPYRLLKVSPNSVLRAASDRPVNASRPK